MLNASAIVTAGNGVNGDNECRRQRSIYTAFEKARATHLSRQLRLRLQYAKLKVEHGWIKQNLNEVENLYFRHSRKSRPDSEPDDSLERGEMRPFPNIPRPDSNVPSPSINPPLNEGASVVEPIQPPSNDCQPNHQTRSLSLPEEDTVSVTPDPDGSVCHRQQGTNPAPQSSSALTTRSPTPHSLSRQPTLSSLDGSAGRSPGSSSASTLTYDSFWSSHSSSSLTHRSRLSESSISLKQPFVTFTSVQKSNPIIPTLSFPSSPPSSNSLHTAMGSFHHADLALAGQENGSLLPPQP